LLKEKTENPLFVYMKNKIPIITLVLLTAFVLYATLVKRVHEEEIKVDTAISIIHQEISSLHNIARLYLPFSGADTISTKIVLTNKLEYDNNSLKLTKVTGLSAWYQVTENNKPEDIVFSLAADTGHSTKISLHYESTLWNKFFGKNNVIVNAQKSLQNLKDYFADTKKMYGYQIEIASVTDTAFLFTSKVVATANKKTAFKALFESLIKEAKEKELGYTGVRIFYYSPFGDDSTHLFTSIGISNTKGVGFTGEYSLKKMPFNGRLLTAFYQGSFGDVHKVVNALNQFQNDNRMTIMAIPFIKLITDGIEFEDSQIIQAKVFYPVF